MKCRYVITALGLLALVITARPASALTTMTEAQQTAAILSLQSSLSGLQKTVTTQSAQIKALQITVGGQTVTLNKQATAITSLQSAVSSDTKTINSQAGAISSLGSTMVGLQNSINNQFATIDYLDSAFGSQAAAITDLEAKTAPLSISGTDLTFTGVNVHVVNGLGSTETQNGLGNLIVGYNESRSGTSYGSDVRTGSHNLVTGLFNNYAASGGIVGGYGNSLNGLEEFAVGALNSVSGNQACVTGGLSNSASGNYTSVLGGQNNTARGSRSVVVAGESNLAQGPGDVVVSGYGSTSDGTDSAILGGYQNYTYNSCNVVSGGYVNAVTSGVAGTVSGGFNLTVTGDSQWAAGNGQAADNTAVRAALFSAN